jgi:hypothetical protein
MKNLTASYAIAVSLLTATTAHAEIQRCATKEFSAWSDLSSGGTGKVYLNVELPNQTPEAIEGLLHGTFNKQAIEAFIQNYCQNGTLTFDHNLTVKEQPLKKYELSTADKTRNVEVTNRNNDSDYTFKDGFEFTENKGYKGRVSLQSATLFLETGEKPTLN